MWAVISHDSIESAFDQWNRRAQDEIQENGVLIQPLSTTCSPGLRTWSLQTIPLSSLLISHVAHSPSLPLFLYSWMFSIGGYKWQTRPLVREGDQYRQDSNFLTGINICHEPQTGLDTKTDHTDWPSVAMWLWLSDSDSDLVAQSAATCSCWLLERGFFYPEDGGDTFLRNVGSHKIYTPPHPRRRYSS
jgi:hypothetical protein